MHALVTVAEGVHVYDVPLRFFGLQLGARMTVLHAGGDLLVHSPVDVDPSALAHLGTPRWVLAPNLFHHLYAGRWIDAGVQAWAAPGLDAKRKDLGFAGLVEPGAQPFGPDIEVKALTCVPFSNEVVVLHRPSRTLVVTDLVFHVPASAPWATRAAMRCLGGYPGCCSTVLERVAMRRPAAREELGAILEWDFDRLVMAHGTIVERGGREALRAAFHWLWA